MWATTRSLKLGFPETDGSLVRELVALAENEFPIVLKAPFEQTKSIAGAVWSAEELLDECRDDGFAKLRFDPGTLDLPMHVHEFSDRFIVVLDGEGLFHISSEPLERFTGERIRSIPVKAGDALTFTRGLMHTFGAAEEGLLLLSYHAPLVELDDPRQYTLPKLIWTPRKLQRICRESQGACKSDVR
ncbi:MAG: cupin domain-containing protein [Pirellulaceae bacterium]